MIIRTTQLYSLSRNISRTLRLASPCHQNMRLASGSCHNMNTTLDIPEHYYKTNKPQREWATDVLNKTTFRHNNYKRILDIGCGTGDVTKMVLNRFPKSDVIHAFDKSPGMIAFAQEHCHDPKIQYSVADADDASTMKAEWKETDLALSFMALHWVRYHNKFAQMLSDLLSSGGEFVFLFVKIMDEPVAMMEALQREERWKPYFKDFDLPSALKGGSSPEYAWRQEPASKYAAMYEQANLDVITCEEREGSYTFPDMEQQMATLRLLPHYALVPEDQHEALGEDVRRLCDEYLSKDDEGRIIMKNVHMYIHGQKR